jgi:hypothetical protein
LLVDFLYTHPTWLVGLLVMAVWTGIALLGLRICHGLVDVQIRHKDTETVGLTYAIVAVVYGVLLALIVVDVFETFAKGDSVATAEANKLSNLMLDSAGLPPQIATEVRADINKYIDLAVKQEWPSQQAGKLDGEVFEPGWTVLAHLSTDLALFEPASMGQNVNKAEMLHAMNDLIKARRSRILAAGDHLPAVIWKMLLLGGAVAVGYTYLFGARSFGIHMAITGLIAATISLVFVLIITLDFPFRGAVSVTSKAFLSVQQTAAGAVAAAPHQ